MARMHTEMASNRLRLNRTAEQLDPIGGTPAPAPARHQHGKTKPEK